DRFLSESIESILDQSLRDFEFIIIDDGSTDGTAGLLSKYESTDARVRIYHQENKGRIESLNRGSTFAYGKYLARMDADDIAVKDRLIWQGEVMENNPEMGGVGGDCPF